ncbi:MAG TPA: polysaccharide biosynthesis C-terminal domain-containing protein [Acidobacteriaceae bacterium]|nr:polysaccharide biosynthesis C-terminal domain-containing protein [Acidobacteriaceae bacterium]
MDEKAPKQSGGAGSQAIAEAVHTEGRPHGTAATFAQNSIMNLGRLFVTAAIAIVLPGYLTRRLSVTTYSAWVLILQLGAYVSYLDFGIQSGIAKFVAEYEAKKDTDGASLRASVGLALMLIASTVGLALTLALAWQVPQLFHDMPAALYRDARLSILFVGVSLSFGLLCSIFPSIFFGLQRYAVPTVILLTNRLLYAAVLVAAVARQQSLAVMGALVAIVNIVTGLLHFEAWRRWACTIRLRLHGLDGSVVRKMLGYCSSLAIWTVGMLCVSGLDVIIVGRYDFRQTAFYSVAALPTGFVTSIVGAALAPLMPSMSALSVLRSPGELGVLLARATRYTSVILLLSGLPLLVAGYWILRVWVGPIYASHAISYLRILVLANILRCTCLPYANMLVATNSQRIAVAGVIAEAITNVGCSIYLAGRIGAIGVAYGTLVGAFVSVGAHFIINMRYTMAKFTISRMRLFLTGLVRPATIAVPSLLLITFWWSSAAPAFNQQIWLGWGLGTLILAWLVGLKAMERDALVGFVGRWVRPRTY